MAELREVGLTIFDTIDGALDSIPSVERSEGKWKLYRHGGWGCRLNVLGWYYQKFMT